MADSELFQFTMAELAPELEALAAAAAAASQPERASAQGQIKGAGSREQAKIDRAAAAAAREAKRASFKKRDDQRKRDLLGQKAAIPEDLRLTSVVSHRPAGDRQYACSGTYYVQPFNTLAPPRRRTRIEQQWRAAGLLASLPEQRGEAAQLPPEQQESEAKRRATEELRRETVRLLRRPVRSFMPAPRPFPKPLPYHPHYGGLSLLAATALDPISTGLPGVDPSAMQAELATTKAVRFRASGALPATPLAETAPMHTTAHQQTAMSKSLSSEGGVGGVAKDQMASASQGRIDGGATANIASSPEWLNGFEVETNEKVQPSQEAPKLASRGNSSPNTRTLVAVANVQSPSLRTTAPSPVDELRGGARQALAARVARAEAEEQRAVPAVPFPRPGQDAMVVTAAHEARLGSMGLRTKPHGYLDVPGVSPPRGFRGDGTTIGLLFTGCGVDPQQEGESEEMELEASKKTGASDVGAKEGAVSRKDDEERPAASHYEVMMALAKHRAAIEPGALPVALPFKDPIAEELAACARWQFKPHPARAQDGNAHNISDGGSTESEPYVEGSRSMSVSGMVESLTGAEEGESTRGDGSALPSMNSSAKPNKEIYASATSSTTGHSQTSAASASAINSAGSVALPARLDDEPLPLLDSRPGTPGSEWRGSRSQPVPPPVSLSPDSRRSATPERAPPLLEVPLATAPSDGDASIQSLSSSSVAIDAGATAASAGSGSGQPVSAVAAIHVPQQQERAPPLGPWPPLHPHDITTNDQDDNASALSMASALSPLVNDDDEEEGSTTASSALVDPAAELMKTLPPLRSSRPASRNYSRGSGGGGSRSRSGSADGVGTRPGSKGDKKSIAPNEQQPRGTLYGGGGGGLVEEDARPISPFGSNAARPAGEHLGPVYQRHVVQSGRFPVFHASAAYQATMDGDDRGWADCALHEAAIRMKARSALSTPTNGARTLRSRSGGGEPEGGDSRRKQAGSRDGGNDGSGGGVVGVGDSSPNARSARSPDTLRSFDTLGNDLNVSLADYSPGMSFRGMNDDASEGRGNVNGRLSPSKAFGSQEHGSPKQGPVPPPKGLPPGLVFHHSSLHYRPSTNDDNKSAPFGGLLKCVNMPVTVGATEAELKHLTRAERRHMLELSRAGVLSSQVSLSSVPSAANRAATTGLGLSAGGSSFAAESGFATSVPKSRRLHRPVPITESFKRDLIAAMARETKLQQSSLVGGEGSRALSRRLSARSNAQGQQDMAAANNQEEGHDEGNSPLMSVSGSLEGSSLLRP